jgi:phosphatidylglycerophosphate synthase
MRNRRRLTLLLLICSLLGALAVPGLATDETTTDTGSTDTSVVEQEELEGTQGPEPAITVPAPTAEEVPADWTYRFLIPTLIALAAIVVIVTTIQYFLQVVRKRYKVVE